MRERRSDGRSNRTGYQAIPTVVAKFSPRKGLAGSALRRPNQPCTVQDLATQVVWIAIIVPCNSASCCCLHSHLPSFWRARLLPVPSWGRIAPAMLRRSSRTFHFATAAGDVNPRAHNRPRPIPTWLIIGPIDDQSDCWCNAWVYRSDSCAELTLFASDRAL